MQRISQWGEGLGDWLWRQRIKLGILAGGFALGIIEAYWSDQKFAGPVATFIKGLIALLASGLVS